MTPANSPEVKKDVTATTPAPVTPVTDTNVDTNLLTHEDKVFIRWLEISEAKTMAQFMGDYQTMRDHSIKIVDLARRISQAVTPNEREALTKVRDAELQNYRQNDEKFGLVYRTKTDDWILRPHFIQNTAIRLLSPVSDQLISELRKKEGFNEADIIARGNQKLIVLSTVEGGQIPILQRNIQLVAGQQNALIQLRAAEKTATNAAESAKIKEEIEKVAKLLDNNAEQMLKVYGIFTNDILIENLKGILWVALVEEELKRYVEKRNSTPAAIATAPAKIEAPKVIAEAPKTDSTKPKKA